MPGRYYLFSQFRQHRHHRLEGTYKTGRRNLEGTVELPVVGVVDVPAAILIRPDGHVAWVGDEKTDGLKAAPPDCFGPPAGR
ncbi:MAG: hypothetical protein ACK4QP_00145 [Pseudorhizobium sp.]